MNEIFSEYGSSLVSVIVTGIILSIGFAFVSGIVDFNLIALKNII